MPRPLATLSLGEFLALLQRRSGISQEELAARVGVSTGSVSHYLRDHSLPPAGVLAKMVAVLADALHEDFELLWRQIGQLLPEPVQIEKDMGVMAQVVGDDPVELWGAFGQVARDDGVDLVAAWSRWAVAKLPGPRFRVYEEWLIRCAEAMRETPLDQVSAARMFDCLDEISVEAGERIDGYEAMLHFYAWLKEVRKGQRTTAEDPADVVRLPDSGS